MPEVVPVELITNKIFNIRGLKVMLDRDLAKLYEVETKVLKRNVRRHIDRFLMILCLKLELQDWRCQSGTSNSDKLPWADQFMTHTLPAMKI